MARALSTLESTHFAGREMEAQKGLKWFTQGDSSSERTGFVSCYPTSFLQKKRTKQRISW